MNQGGQKEPEKNHTHPRPGPAPKPAHGQDAPPDLDELWQRFNHRLAHLFSLRKDRLKEDSSPPSGNGQVRLRIVIGTICSLMAAVWLGSGLYIVSPTQNGAVLQLGAYRYTTLPGIRWHWPFPFQSHELIDASTHTIEIGSNSAEEIAPRPDALVLTRDGGLVNVRFALHYRVMDVRAFLLNYASAQTHIIQMGEAALHEIFGALTLEDTLNLGRVDVSSKLVRKVQEMLDAQHAGILVTGVGIRNVQLPETIKVAFEDAVNVAQERERQKSKAVADAQRIEGQGRVGAQEMVDEAERYKARAVSMARGENERFKQVLIGYSKAPEVMRERLYLDTMREIYANSVKVLISGKVAQQIVLPLERLRVPDKPVQKTENMEEVKKPSAESIHKEKAASVEDPSQHSREVLRGRERRKTGIEE